MVVRLRGLGRRRLSLRARVAVLSAFGVALAVVVVSLAGWWLMHVRMYENVAVQLRADTDTAARAATPGEALRAMQVADELPRDWREVEDNWPEARQLVDVAGPPPPIVVRFLDTEGNLVSSSAGSPWLGPVTAQAVHIAASGSGQDLADAGPGTTFYRVSTVARDGGAVQVARRVTGIEGTLDDLRILLTLIGLAGAGLAGVVGWGVARAGLRPVHRLTAMGKASLDLIAAHDLESTLDQFERVYLDITESIIRNTEAAQ